VSDIEGVSQRVQFKEMGGKRLKNRKFSFPITQERDVRGVLLVFARGRGIQGKRGECCNFNEVVRYFSCMREKRRQLA